MKLLSAALVAALLALQAPPAPLVFGRQASTIRPADIEAIARAVAPYGARPWLLTEFRSLSFADEQRRWIARAYLAPSTSTPELRRGPLIDLTTELTTQNAPGPATWKVVDDPSRIRTWAQVALPGRSFDDVKGESDENLPLAIHGQITDADLVSSVRFLRTRPPFPAPRPGLYLPRGFPGPIRGILAPAILNPALPAVRISVDGSPGSGCGWSMLLQRPWSEALQRRDGEWFVESIEGGGCA